MDLLNITFEVKKKRSENVRPWIVVLIDFSYFESHRINFEWRKIMSHYLARYAQKTDTSMNDTLKDSFFQIAPHNTPKAHLTTWKATFH